MTLPAISGQTVIGYIDQSVINLLGLQIISGTPILVGPSNIEHMKKNHPEDFEKYFSELTNILSSPDHVIPNPKDGSLQYIKKLDEFILVAVRVSGGGKFFSKSLYKMGHDKIERFNKNGLFEKYKLY
jgi:hypothetical protein